MDALEIEKFAVLSAVLSKVCVCFQVCYAMSNSRRFGKTYYLPFVERRNIPIELNLG